LALVLVLGACATDQATTSPTLAATPEADPGVSVGTVETSPQATLSTGSKEATGTRWGFVPFPASPDGESVADVFEFVATEGDLIAIHSDDGIPWQGLIGDGDLPTALVDEMAALRAFADSNPQLGVYVATAITDQDRSGIPGTWRAGGPPPELAGRTFDDPEVRQGIKAWVKFLAERLEPDYFNLAVEMNMYATARPEDYPNLVSLYRELYAEMKADYPDTVFFASFQMELADPGAAADLVDSLDLIGISSYPYINGGGIPAGDYFDAMADLGLPVAIAETGFPAAPMPTLGGDRTYSPEDQAAYVEWLGQRASSLDLQFVTWFFPSDITGMIDPLPSEAQAPARLFEFLGLRTADGTPRPALDVWRSLVSD